jgi:coenzyme F420-reducing hydrogenase gamma subunit
LTLLDCEDELLAVAGELEIVHFPEASSRTAPEGPFDLTLVEGSVSTPEHLGEIRHIRERSRFLVTIGACATAGGIQALRNFGASEGFSEIVYAWPEYVLTLADSMPVADHVKVDFELRGCPIDKGQLLELITAYLVGRRPAIRDVSVCTECKSRGSVCVSVAKGIPCLGPVTHAGCGALCPAFGRGCYACFGPKENAATASFAGLLKELGLDEQEIARAFRLFTGYAEAFREESRRHE